MQDLRFLPGMWWSGQKPPQGALSGLHRGRRPCRTMPRPPAKAAQQPRSKLSHVNEHGRAIRGWPQHVQGQRQASPSRTNHVARPSGGSAVAHLPPASGAIRAELSDNEQCQCSSRMPRRCANGPRNEHGRELEAAAAADSAMYPTTNPGCVACCFVMGLLLLLRPNRAPNLGGVLHEGEVCASRHASRRPRPRSTHCGQKRGMRHDAPLLLIMAWLGVCSAKGTICSVKPSVCSGTYSSPSLYLDQRYGGVSGTMPTQLGVLTALTYLDLDGNALSGSLPTQLGALTTLTYLYLDGNELSGSLPTQLGALTLLTEMDLDENELSGSLPTQLGALTAMASLELDENELSGSLPTQLGALTLLEEASTSCRLGGTNNSNNFSCPAPVEIPLLCAASLQCVSLGGNVSGAMPSELSSGAVLLWVLLPLGMLFAVFLVLLCRLYSRILRDRTNLRLSRDRANLDLQLLAHQVQRAQTQPNDLASQPDSLSERRYTSLAGATVVSNLSVPPGPPSSSAASSAAAASLPPGPSSSSSTASTTGPTSSSKGKGKAKAKVQACKAKVKGLWSLNKVPLSWVEADRQFYASAAGKAYLAAAATTEDLGSSSATPTPSVVRPSAARSGQVGTQPAEVSATQPIDRLYALSTQSIVPPALPSNVLLKRPVPPVPAPTPLAKKTAVKRRFTSEGVEIHHLLAEGARAYKEQAWEVLSGAERAQLDRDKAPSSAPTPLSAEDPLLRPPLLRSGQKTPFALSSGPFCARRDLDKATSSPPAPAPATAPSTPSAPEESSDANVRELAELTDMPDEDAAAALTNHLLDLRRVASVPILPNARAANAAAAPPGRPAPPAPAPREPRISEYIPWSALTPALNTDPGMRSG